MMPRSTSRAMLGVFCEPIEQETRLRAQMEEVSLGEVGLSWEEAERLSIYGYYRSGNDAFCVESPEGLANFCIGAVRLWQLV